MKIRGLFAALLVAASLAGCTRSATAPEVPRRTPVAAPAMDEATPPPADTTENTRTEAGGGILGSGH